jgi:hypothetical protein
MVPRTAVEPCVDRSGASSSKRAIPPSTGREEPLLLGARRGREVLAALDELRVHVAHRVDHALDHAVERGLRGAAQQVGVAHGAAEDAPQHVAAPLVGREHAVGQQERHGARVVGEHAVARRVVAADHRVARAPAVRGAHRRLDLRDERREHVGVEVVGHALQHGRDALEPRPGVHARLGQRHERAVGLPVVLHEHEVPDLEEAPGLRALDERLRRELRAAQAPSTRRSRRRAGR